MIGAINSNKDYGARTSIDTHVGTINAHGLTFQITIPTTAWISVMADPPAVDTFYQASVNANTISGKNLSGYNMILIPKYSTVFPQHGLPESLATAVSKIQKIRNSDGTLYFSSTTNNGSTLDKPEIELVFDVHVLDKVTGEASCVIITNADTIRDVERTINLHLNDEESHKDTQYTVINNTTSTDSSEVLSAPQANPEINGTLAGNINRMIAPYFSATKNYYKGESCTYGNNVWLFFEDKPAGGWDQSKCYPTSIYSQITGNHLSREWFSIPSAAMVNPDNYGFCWRIHNMIAPYYSIYKTYSLGEYVTYQYKIYRCQITVDSPESFTSFKWVEVTSLINLINAIVSRLDAYDNSKLVMYKTTEGERTKMVDKNDQVLYTENLTKNIIDETTEVSLDTTLTSISNHMVADNPHGLTVTRKATADTGYVASYELMCNGQKFGDTINIPKDFLLKSATRKVCDEIDVPVTGYVIGDKYIDFEINVVDASETTTHLYILLSDLGGTGGSVTLDPLKSNGLTFTDEVLALELATASTPGAMSKEDKTKLDMFNLSGIQTNDTLKYDGVTGKLIRDPYIADLNITVLTTDWVYDEINHVWKYTYEATSVTNTMIPHVYQQFPEDSAEALLDRIEGSNIGVVRFIDGFFVMECYTNKPSRDLSFVIKVVK